MLEAREGSVIALARGVYDEPIDLEREVTIWGACVSETIVTQEDPSNSRATIVVEGSGTVVKNLTISGQQRFRSRSTNRRHRVSRQRTQVGPELRPARSRAGRPFR